MLSYAIDFVKKILGYNDNESNEEENVENYLAEQLLNLEFSNENCNKYLLESEENTVVPLEQCFERSGKITYVCESYILINGDLYYGLDNCSSQQYNLNDSIVYLAYKHIDDVEKVLRIVQNQGTSWGDSDNVVKHYSILKHAIVGEVGLREGRFVYIKNTKLKFSLDSLEASFVPMPGDWLEMTCRVQWDENVVKEITADQVIEVLSLKPLRYIVKMATISYCADLIGVCDSQIFFDQNTVIIGLKPNLKHKVIVEAVESNQPKFCTWRALKIINDVDILYDRQYKQMPSKEHLIETLDLENEKNISVTHPVAFKEIQIEEEKDFVFNVLNNSTNTYKITNWKVSCHNSAAQIQVKTLKNKPILLKPAENIHFVLTCKPLLLGQCIALLIIQFDDFIVKRHIAINATHSLLHNNDTKDLSKNNHNAQGNKTTKDQLLAMNKIINNDRVIYVPGVKLNKAPAFVPVKLGMFNIPENIWKVMLNHETSNSTTYNDVLIRIEKHIPFLLTGMNMNNYTDRWHTLLYMEEVAQNIHMRQYDLPKTFLDNYQEYLTVDVPGLAEKRPSLIVGDKVVVKDIWDTEKPAFEGYIHSIKGFKIFIKFNKMFHDMYTGYDIALQFHSSRTVFRRCHQAINLAISNLGPEILFPRQVKLQLPQVNENTLQSINWHNKTLNSVQKKAVRNILLGICRPLPYCVYGPPGTGKTITLVETILQILTLLPQSRILIATPSNSAANLITERLLKYKDEFTGSLLRLVAHYLIESDNLPEEIKPYCATIDIATEGTAENKQSVRNKTKINCSSSFIGRHRITISTCVSLGALAQMGLPRGHFTHVIVDEAGQAIEPEIMIPLTFIDKSKGQIILAGDPKQLGPVVISKYCTQYGMSESYLSRLFGTFPYQKDKYAFGGDGYDQRFLTMLKDNYRSLANVLVLPSNLFYEGSLVVKRKDSDSKLTKIIADVSALFPDNKHNGGIYMLGVKGFNCRAEDSPSHYNPQEALSVVMAVCKLYKKNVSPDDIGIITPYIAQVRYIRKLFDSTGAELPKVGSVEEFQGQEKPIIFVSTVRSEILKENLDVDKLYSIGFISCPNRVNVAMTRGEAAVVICGNPHTLYMDELWNKIITHVVVNNCYTGCDLPEMLRNVKNNNL